MPEALPKRQCGRCYFCRDLAGTLHCVRNPPQLDLETGEARWPRVQETDICGGFRCCDGCPLESDCWPRHDLPIYTDRFGDYCKIPRTKGLFVKVDPEDYIWLSQFRWHCKVNKDAVYAVRTIQVKGRSQRIFMHRLLMNTPAGMVCDHINHDGLDDRKANLRNCTIAQNNANRRSAANSSSKYIGVSRDKRRNKWVAHIKINGEEKYLGSYDVEEDAARAYDAAAWAQHGVYANLNFPEDWPEHPANRDRRLEAGGCRGERSFARNRAPIQSTEDRGQTPVDRVGRASPLAREPDFLANACPRPDRGTQRPPRPARRIEAGGQTTEDRGAMAGDGNCRVDSQSTRKGPCNREPRERREKDPECRVGRAPKRSISRLGSPLAPPRPSLRHRGHQGSGSRKKCHPRAGGETQKCERRSCVRIEPRGARRPPGP